MIYDSRRGERAISDVIGTILMVAIVTMVVLGIGMVVISETTNQPERGYADVTFETHEDDTVTVHWATRGTAERVRVSNGTETKFIEEFNGNVTIGPAKESRGIEVWGMKNGERTHITRYLTPDYTTSLYMESSTCDSEGDCGSKIVYNGTDIDTNEGGVTVISLNPDGTFHSHAWFNTDSQDQYRAPSHSMNDDAPAVNPVQACSGCANSYLSNHLDNIPDQHEIILVGSGQPGRSAAYPSDDGTGINDNVEQQYEALGARFSGDDILEYQSSWILVSVKGDDRVFEKHAPSPDGDPNRTANVSAHYLAD